MQRVCKHGINQCGSNAHLIVARVHCDPSAVGLRCWQMDVWCRAACQSQAAYSMECERSV